MRPSARTSGLRFTAPYRERINRIINQALSLGERIPMSDAVRLALIAYDPRSLTTADLAALHATDGRLRRRLPGQ
jgi:phage baseplate assembly protein W